MSAAWLITDKSDPLRNIAELVEDARVRNGLGSNPNSMELPVSTTMMHALFVGAGQTLVEVDSNHRTDKTRHWATVHVPATTFKSRDAVPVFEAFAKLWRPESKHWEGVAAFTAETVWQVIWAELTDASVEVCNNYSEQMCNMMGLVDKAATVETNPGWGMTPLEQSVMAACAKLRVDAELALRRALEEAS